MLPVGTGFVDLGPRGYPWIVALGITLPLLIGWLATQRQVRFGQKNPRRFWRPLGRIFLAAALGSVLIPLTFAGQEFEPLTPGAFHAALSGVAEVKDDGTTRRGSSSTYELISGSPRYIARVAPGSIFDIVVGIKNTGPISMTVEGWLGDITATPSTIGVRSALTALGRLPEDLTPAAATSADVLPYQPIEIPAGDTGYIVMQFSGGSCADAVGA